MKGFMTRMSDYFNERRNDPERQEDHLAAVIVGVAAVAVIVLLLLLLWGHTAEERGRKEAEQAARLTEQAELVHTTHEEETKEYMASNDGQEELRREELRQEEIKQEYLKNIEYLNSKIEELYNTMIQMEETLRQTIEDYKQEDRVLRERVNTLHTEVAGIVQNLKETQTRLYDLYDLVQIMDREKLPMIQKQLLEIRTDMDKVHTDISGLYAKIAALEQEDVKLWASIGNMEKILKKTLNQNITEVNNQFDVLLDQLDILEDQLKTVENRIGQLTGQTLKYRYDAQENTLYLEPYSE